MAAYQLMGACSWMQLLHISRQETGLTRTKEMMLETRYLARNRRCSQRQVTVTEQVTLRKTFS